jgi:hypothetical protein
VLPLKAGEKAPLSEVVPDSLKDASTEIDLIEVGGLHTQTLLF